MPNHFHLLLRQNEEVVTGKLISKICTSHSKYFNKRYQHVGHVFQDQFKQVAVEDNHQLTWLSAYIHQNPKVAGLVKKPEDYAWSSYSSYLGNENDGGLCEKDIILDQFSGSGEYRDFVDSSFSIIKRKTELEQLFLD